MRVVDVAERLQAEQRGGVIDVVEDERRRLIDRRRARAGGRVGLRAGMNRKRGEAGRAFGHGASVMAVSPDAQYTDLRIDTFVITNDVL